MGINNYLLLITASSYAPEIVVAHPKLQNRSLN